LHWTSAICRLMVREEPPPQGGGGGTTPQVFGQLEFFFSKSDWPSLRFFYNAGVHCVRAWNDATYQRAQEMSSREEYCQVEEADPALTGAEESPLLVPAHVCEPHQATPSPAIVNSSLPSPLPFEDAGSPHIWDVLAQSVEKASGQDVRRQIPGGQFPNSNLRGRRQNRVSDYSEQKNVELRNFPTTEVPKGVLEDAMTDSQQGFIESQDVRREAPFSEGHHASRSSPSLSSSAQSQSDQRPIKGQILSNAGQIRVEERRRGTFGSLPEQLLRQPQNPSRCAAQTDGLRPRRTFQSGGEGPRGRGTYRYQRR
jgi:hypothetical protein